MPDQQQIIADNLARVRERIATVATAAGRLPGDVRLVAVTKYVGPHEAAALIAAGCDELGESRPQELWAKAAAPELASARWHLVGHLQRNKVKRTLPLVDLIHSVDSERLLAAIDEAAAARGRTIDVLLEINCSGEEAKHGFAPSVVEGVLFLLGNLLHVRVRGLMTMAGRTGGLDAARRDFAALRELRDTIQPQCPDGVLLNELSMGMSGDFEEAIRAGATIVRVGSALFDTRDSRG